MPDRLAFATRFDEFSLMVFSFYVPELVK
jgi:hypothetical protein